MYNRLLVTLILTISFTYYSGFGQDTLKINLDKALEIALSENPTIKLADKEIERVDYSRREVLSVFFPTVSAGANYNRNIKKPVIFFPEGFPIGPVLEIGSDNSYAASVTASLPIFSATLFKTIQVSEVDMQIAIESARASKLNMVTEVKNAFYTLLLANNSYEVMKMSVDNAQKNLKNIRDLYQQGVVAEYDVIRSEVQVRNLNPALLQAENGVNLSAMMLKILLGVDGYVEIEVSGSLSDYETDFNSYKSILNIPLESNTNLKQVELQELKLQKQYDVLRSTRLPTLAAFGNYQFQSQANDFKFSEYEWVRTFAAGLQLQVPIFQGFSKRYREQQVRVGIDQLKIQRDYLSHNLTLQARNALNNMKRSYDQIGSSKEGIALADKGYSIAQTRYSTGTGTVLELNDAEISLTQAKLNYNQALYDYLQAKVQFESIVGNE